MGLSASLPTALKQKEVFTGISALLPTFPESSHETCSHMGSLMRRGEERTGLQDLQEPQAATSGLRWLACRAWPPVLRPSERPPPRLSVLCLKVCSPAAWPFSWLWAAPFATALTAVGAGVSA